MNISQTNIKILFFTSALYFLLINNISSDIVAITSYNICAVSLFYIASYRILSQIKSTSDKLKIHFLYGKLFHINKLRPSTAYFLPIGDQSIKTLYSIIIFLKAKTFNKQQVSTILNIEQSTG